MAEIADEEMWELADALTMAGPSCNFCQMNAIRRQAGDKPVELSARNGGVDAFVGGKWVAWFMALPEKCAC